ncbi:hypothetical protein [Priestia aryabhattai]
MNSKQWIKRLFLTSLIIVVLPVSAIMGFNYYIDPLWNFDHKNKYNDYQIGFDERQQKTNYINSRKDFEYDSLMIGTSRVTYMNQHKFKNEKAFNYSLSSLHIDEYLPYIDYATKKNGKDFKTIYMELYVNSYDSTAINTNRSPSIYFQKSEEPFYKITSLFSKSTFDSSIENYKISKAKFYAGPRSYNRDNVGITTYPNDRLEPLWDRFKASFEATTSKPFIYDDDYKQKLSAIKKAYPNTRFVVFTDPIPAKRFDLIMDNEDQRNAYKRWYKEMVSIFGEVYSFQGHTPITTDMNNYFDWFHYYPNVGDDMIAAFQNPAKHKDILKVVNDNNLSKYLNSVYIKKETH